MVPVITDLVEALPHYINYVEQFIKLHFDDCIRHSRFVSSQN